MFAELQPVAARKNELYKVPIVLDQLRLVAVVEAQMGDVGGFVTCDIYRRLMHADLAGVVVGRQPTPVLGSCIAGVTPRRVMHFWMSLLDARSGEVDLTPVERLDRPVVGDAAYESLQPVDLVLRNCANLVHHEPVNRFATRRHCQRSLVLVVAQVCRLEYPGVEGRGMRLPRRWQFHRLRERQLRMPPRSGPALRCDTGS